MAVHQLRPQPLPALRRYQPRRRLLLRLVRQFSHSRLVDLQQLPEQAPAVRQLAAQTQPLPTVVFRRGHRLRRQGPILLHLDDERADALGDFANGLFQAAYGRRAVRPRHRPLRRDAHLFAPEQSRRLDYRRPRSTPHQQHHALRRALRLPAQRRLAIGPARGQRPPVEHAVGPPSGQPVFRCLDRGPKQDRVADSDRPARRFPGRPNGRSRFL